MSSCFRHPEKRARRKCFVCQRIICMDCYYRREHHLFCGPRCYARFFLTDRRERLGAAMSRPVPAWLFAIVLALLITPAAALMLSAARELEAPVFGREASPRAAISAAIDSIEEGDRTMSVRGRATAGALVILLRDGVSVASSVADGAGHFSFSLDLDSSASRFAVAAVAPSQMASVVFRPRAPLDLRSLPEASVRSASTRFVESFARGSGVGRELVLSLDAGSTDAGAREILAALRRRGIRTTIFLTGEFIERYPEVVREAAADGHEIGNHTWSHPHLTTFARNRRQLTLPGMTRAALASELGRTADAFRRVTGHEMAKLWRAPFGEENSEIRGWAADLGYLHVGWTRGRKYSLDSLDWVADPRSPNYYPAEQVAQRLLNFDLANGTSLDGGIILMHLGSDRPEDERVARILPSLIDDFEQKGFRFVTVSEMRRASAEPSHTAVGSK